MATASPAAPASAQERHVIDDPRLEADSTLFPYEWPALDGLMARLVRLRQSLEDGNVAALSSALPEIGGDVEALIGDSIPPLLAGRGEELRGRMIVLREALRAAEALADSALAAPPPDTAAATGKWSGGFPVTLGPAGEASDDADARAGEPYDPAGWPAAADADTSLADLLDSASAPGPVESFLRAWRDVYAHAEAIVHRVRDPGGAGPT